MAIGNVAISIPLGLAFGGVGCALGTAISMIIGNGLVMNWYYQKHIGLDMTYFWKSIVSMLPAMIAPAALGIAAVNLHAFSGYRGVILFAAPYSLLFCVSLYCFAMNEDERGMVKGIVTRLARR